MFSTPYWYTADRFHVSNSKTSPNRLPRCPDAYRDSQLDDYGGTAPLTPIQTGRRPGMHGCKSEQQPFGRSQVSLEAPRFQKVWHLVSQRAALETVKPRGSVQTDRAVWWIETQSRVTAWHCISICVLCHKIAVWGHVRSTECY